MAYAFKVSGLFVKKLRTDKGYRLEADLTADDYDEFRDLDNPENEAKVFNCVLMELDQALVKNDVDTHITLDTKEEARRKFGRMRAMYCQQFKMTKEEYNAKYLDGRSSKDLTEEELLKKIDALKISLKHNQE